MRDQQHVAIVGAGFSGAALAAHLLAHEREHLHVTLIEANERFGRGVAYGTHCAEHLLNTRADRMSLLAEDPEHFVRWCRGRGLAIGHGDFAERRIYGDYVEHTLRALASGREAPLARLLHARVAAVEPATQGFELKLDDGRSLHADDVVLATGHPLPADPLARWLPSDERRYIRDPWCTAALEAIGAEDSVLLLGTGLTMVDAALSLAARGHRGRIDALSRRGLLPQAHAPVAQLLPRDLHDALEHGVARGNVRCALRAVRRAIAAAEARGLGWQCVIDALRTRTSALWAQLGPADRRRFVERLRPYWDVHRHRLPPPTADRLQALRANGRLRVLAGRVLGAAPRSKAIDLEFRGRHETGGRSERYAWIVNCTGPTFEKRSSRGLERQMLERGLLISDPLGARLPDDRERHCVRDARPGCGIALTGACVPAAVVGAHGGARAAPASLRARRRANAPAGRPCASDSPSRAGTVSVRRKRIRFRVFAASDRSSA